MHHNTNFTPNGHFQIPTAFLRLHFTHPAGSEHAQWTCHSPYKVLFFSYPSDLMKSTVVGESLSTQLQFCSRENQLATINTADWETCISPQICLLLCLQPVQHCAQCQVLSLGFVPVSNMHLHQWAACISSYFFFQALVTFHHTQIMYFGPVCHSQGNSIKDGFHCFQVQSSGNLAKYIHNHIIMPLLVF